MSAPNSDSENSYASDNSDYNFIPGYEIEVESEIANEEQQTAQPEEGNEAVGEPYIDEPVMNGWKNMTEKEKRLSGGNYKMVWMGWIL